MKVKRGRSRVSVPPTTGHKMPFTAQLLAEWRGRLTNDEGRRMAFGAPLDLLQASAATRVPRSLFGRLMVVRGGG